jgi:hypothetical protein
LRLFIVRLGAFRTKKGYFYRFFTFYPREINRNSLK